MFYRGVVENNVDPQKFGRVQVRVFGIHEEGSSVSTSALPWAEVSGGTDFGLIAGVGVTSVLRVGTVVWVFFNNDDYNFPVVFAVVKGSNDINDVAKGSYTNIATIKTASGHIIELSDAPGNEQIKVTHKMGTFILIDKDGNITTHGVKNNTFTLLKDHDATIDGNSSTLVKIDETVTINGNRTVTVKGGSSYKLSGSSNSVIEGSSNNTIQGNNINNITGNIEETISGSSTSSTSGTNHITAATIYLN